MARKSRKVGNTAMKPEIRQIFRVGIYVRLSNEDISSGESNSLENQKNIILNYLKDKPDFVVVKEYEDNGRSGTNFQRLGIKEVIQDVNDGVINCVIVKDLSRFGRNYIEVTKYLEDIFGVLKVRFIAINDGYDNFEKNNVDNHLTFSFKNILNDIYAKDTSMKIISAKKQKRESGQFLGNAPYGYLRAKDGTNKLVIDPVASRVVKQIFAWRVDGLSVMAIINKLVEMNVDCPLVYKFNNKISNYKNDEVKGNWRHSTVLNILKNEVYIGNTVYNKKQSSIFSGVKGKANHKSDWIVMTGTHEAIVDKEVFNKVAFSFAKEKKKSLDENLFKGKLVCGVCGKQLSRKVKHLKTGARYEYRCEKSYSYETKCGTKGVSARELEKCVLQVLKMEISLFSNGCEVSKKNKKEKMTGRCYSDFIDEQISGLNEQKVLNYENLKEKRIDIEVFELEKIRINEKILSLNKMKDGSKKGSFYMAEVKADGGKAFGDKLCEWRKAVVLTREMVEIFVDKVVLVPSKEVEIRFNFAMEEVL